MARSTDPDDMTLLPSSRMALSRVELCRREASRIYKLTLAEKLKPVDAARLVRILEAIANLTERATVEHRLDEIEKLLKENPAWQEKTNLHALRSLNEH